MKGIVSCTDCLHKRGEKVSHFLCPTDGLIHQECVDFLCNKCGTKDIVYQNGMYLCPECLTKPDGFRCRLCGSREIVVKTTEVNRI